MNQITRFQQSAIATAIVGVLSAQPLWAAEQDSAEDSTRRNLEVIQVTGQKRVQSLQDVPASITTMDGEKLANSGISQMEEMSDYVPNFTVTKSGQGYNIYMRGLGSGPNQGFEQTVGTYVDGIYRGRAILMRSSFLDLEMVEVLRGPQGTLFGMNTTAGALNLTSKNATDDFEASLKGYFVPTFNKQDIEAVVSGGLTDDLRARFAAKYEKDHGYVTNVVTGDDEPARENFSGRLTLDWDINERFNANLKLQRDQDTINGRNVVVSVEPYLTSAGTPQSQALLAGIQEYQLDYRSANTNPKLGERQFEKSSADHVTLNLSYELANDHQLAAVTGWQSYQLNGAKDQDSTPRALIYSPHFSEKYHQFSQEFRITSPGGETLDYILGAYYQSSKLNYQENSLVYPLALLGMRDYQQESDLWALFAQFDYHISEKLTASFGLRYSDETKEGHKQMRIIDPKTGDVLANSALVNPPALAGALNKFGLPGLPGNVYELMLGTKFSHLDPLLLGTNSQNIPNALYGTIDSHNLNQSRSEKSFTPSLTLNYQLDDDAMIYAKAGKGFKSGGYDARSNLAGNFEFEEEQVVAFELGAKLTLDEGAAELNIALFHMSFDDLQTSVFDGQVGFNVQNAGEATTMGLEIDARWLVADEITLVGSLGVLDFEWDDFRGAKCFSSNVLVSSNLDSSGRSCDLTGETNALVSDTTMTFGVEHATEVFERYSLITNLDVNYRSEFYTATDLNPFTKQEGYAKINLRIALSNDENWEVALVAKNLSDKVTRNFSFDVPFTKGAYANMVEPGRSIGLQIKYDFY